MGDVRVSLAEIIEVRGCPLNDEELLALIIIASEQLAKTPPGVFTPENVFVHMLGELEIEVATPDEVSEQFVPPEIREGNTNPEPGAVHVFCLGEVVRVAGGRESSNADVFSLLNVMTVAHVATRPSIVRLTQMAKNKLSIQNPKALLAELYVLVMGDEMDEDEDLDALSGEYILDALGENGELKETHWDKSQSRSPDLSITKVDDSESGAVTLTVEGDKQWLKASVSGEDPFENTDPTNLATLSGRDPFNSEFIGQSQLETTSSEDHLDFDMEDEPRKEKQRKLLIDASDMLMGSSMMESLEKPVDKKTSKKPVSWPEPGQRHEIDYDDDIVEYKEEELAEEPISSFVSGHIFKMDEEPAPPYDFFDRPIGNRPDALHVNPAAEKSESVSSLSPISEANENMEKGNEASVSEQSSPEKTPIAITVPPPRYIKNVDNNKVSQVIPEDEEVTIPSMMKETEPRKWFDYDNEEENEQAPTHVEAVVVEKPKRDYAAEEESAILPILRRESDAVTTGVGFVAPKILPPKEEVTEEEDQQFSRRNSLVPSRISGRKPSLRHAKRAKGLAEPEFVMNANAPSVCLKAPAMRKKKMSLHRVEQTGVTVELLNGKRVEVSCRSDAVASEVADVVMRHINFNENSFFALTVLRDGEHFFLEEHQRLEKFSPPGWKNAHHFGAARRPYVLHLRFRYYPASVDFIKTDVVLHELYLQLRRDVIEDRLQPPRDAVFELGALALQAEYSDRPNPAVVEYFKLEHYLPKGSHSVDDQQRTMTVLSELHGHYSGVKSRDAESQYIMRCQRLPDYGGHFYRVYKSKPSSNLGNTPLGDPQTGFAQWIGILPRGIVQYEDHRGVRQPVAEHLWQDTQTLQFDKKRFVIVSEVHQPPQSVFYTDHYTKSAYFVRFAASQHRFMIKMRHWSQTLQGEGTMRTQNVPDVGVDSPLRSLTSSQEQVGGVSTAKKNSRSKPQGDEVDLEKASELFAKVDPDRRPSAQFDDASPTDQALPVQKAEDVRSSESPNDRLQESSPEDDSSECGEGSRFEVTLTKDPRIGLGLTLVDGKLNGIIGIYVKSVTDAGPGKNMGIIVGDRLMSVGGVSLVGKDRHATVNLVKQSGDVVFLSIFRLDAVSSALTATKRKQENGIRKPESALKAPAGTARSRTPPAPRKSAATNRRQRAVSDFGAVGDTLPELNSEDLLADIRKEARLRVEPSTAKEERGDIKLPASSMYRFDGVDEEDHGLNDRSPVTTPAYLAEYHSRHPWSSANGSASALSKTSVETWPGDARASNSEWIDSLEDERPSDVVAVRLDRSEKGSLGVQIASSCGAVYIKQLTAEPATSNPDIHVGDRLVSVNGERLDNLTHQQVVEMLKKGGASVVLGLQRPVDNSSAGDDTDSTITVILEKSLTGSLGLSLAKKTGYDGIFIRMIGPGSAADVDGTLRVGDRIWQVNGQLVNNCSPGAIVDLLKSADNPVEIIIKRAISN